jgi:hypothetical protein
VSSENDGNNESSENNDTATTCTRCSARKSGEAEYFNFQGFFRFNVTEARKLAKGQKVHLVPLGEVDAALDGADIVAEHVEHVSDTKPLLAVMLPKEVRILLGHSAHCSCPMTTIIDGFHRLALHKAQGSSDVPFRVLRAKETRQITELPLDTNAGTWVGLADIEPEVMSGLKSLASVLLNNDSQN